jgi:hypothetical protein
MTKTRKERRLDARKNKTNFKPQYNNGIRYDAKGNAIDVGGSPKSYEEMNGIGYERFNSKYVTIKEEK